MKVVYASRTGNVQSLIEKLEINDAIKIGDGVDTISEDYIIFTYTDGYGEVPYEVEEFLKANTSNLKGVVVSGSTSFGEAFCGAGDVIASEYNVPVLYKVEESGTDEDVKNIKELIK